jgi:hypothetical protein
MSGKKQYIFACYLSLMLFSALLVNLAARGGTAKACDHLRPRDDRAGAVVKADPCRGDGCSEGITVAVRNQSGFIVDIAPITVNGGQPIVLNGFEQQIPVTFFIKMVNSPGGIGANWEVTAFSSGVSIVTEHGPVLQPLILTVPTPVTVTCIPPVTDCTQGLKLATHGDLASPLGVVLLQTTQIRAQASSFLLRVDAQFTLPATAILDHDFMAMTVVVNTDMYCDPI